MDDAVLIARIRGGDKEAAGELFDGYGDMLYRFIYTKTFHRETAEDLLSQVFLKALPHLPQFDCARGSIKSFLFRVAHTAVIDHYRSQHKHMAVEAAWDVPDDAQIEVDTDAKMELERVRKAMEELLPKERSLVIMRVWDDLSHAEIATLLGKREDAVKMAYSRALAKLKKLL